MKIRTLLIDGSFLLKRSFYGGKNVFTKSFGHCGGLYQFMTMTRKLIKNHMINKDHFFARMPPYAWDEDGSGFLIGQERT